MKHIKFVLTERWYAWEDARWNAMSDPSVDMYAEDGQSAYDESKDVAEEAVRLDFSVPDARQSVSNLPSQDAFEKAEQASETTPAEGGRYIPPGVTPTSTGQDARL